MPIAASDLAFMLAAPAASQGAANAQADKNASLGKFVSTTAMGSGAGALFDDISGAENAASTVDYRCVFVQNNHPTLTASNLSLYLSAEVAGGASIQVATDNIAASAKASSSAQAATIANETTAPSGVSAFSAPSSDGAGLNLGTLAPGQVKAFWVKRSAANTAAVAGDGVTFGLGFDTPA